MIKVKDVSKIYGSNVVLSEINLNIDKNEFVFFVGPNGAGKSTLLKMFYRSLLPEKGSIFIDQVNVCKLRPKQIPFLRRNIGVVFQDYKLLPQRTVYENVAFALKVLEKNSNVIKQQVLQVLDIVGLIKRIDFMPSQLSGGEQQKVSIARAIVNNPPVLLADEPTGNLDPEASWEIMQLLNKINEKDTTVVVATHDKQIVDSMRKRVIEINRGKITRDQKLGAYSNVL